MGQQLCLTERKSDLLNVQARCKPYIQRELHIIEKMFGALRGHPKPNWYNALYSKSDVLLVGEFPVSSLQCHKTRHFMKIFFFFSKSILFKSFLKEVVFYFPQRA